MGDFLPPPGAAAAPLRARQTSGVLHVLALLLTLVAVACMSLAIIGMVTGRPGDRAGWALRAVAVLCFGGAVALNIAAH